MAGDTLQQLLQMIQYLYPAQAQYLQPGMQTQVGGGVPVATPTPAGTPTPRAPAVGGIPVTKQNNRRYGGSPQPAPLQNTYGDFMRRANEAMRGTSTFAQPGGVPVVTRPGSPYAMEPIGEAPGWATKNIWDAIAQGRNPLEGVPQDEWPNALDVLQNVMPFLQMQNQQRNTATAQDQWNTQFVAGRDDQAWNQWLQEQQMNTGQRNWEASRNDQLNQVGYSNALQTFQTNEDVRRYNQQFDATRGDTAFNQWLQQQQLGQQGQQIGMQGRQIDLQAQQDAFVRDMQLRGFDAQQAQTAWTNAFSQTQADRAQGNWGQEFQANRADAAWGQGFQQNQADRAQNNWGQEFAANRADAAWGQGFQEKQYGEGVRQFDTNQGNWTKQYDANRADTAWGQGFQEKQHGEGVRQFDTTLARQDALDKWNQAFSQGQFDWSKQMDERRNALQEEGQYLGAFGRKFGPAISNM
jgi:hypothetical protein